MTPFFYVFLIKKPTISGITFLLIQEEQLKGIQLFADKDSKSQFMIDYNIS